MELPCLVNSYIHIIHIITTIHSARLYKLVISMFLELRPFITNNGGFRLSGLGRVNVLSSTRRRRPEPSNRPILKRTGPLDDGKGAVWGRFLDHKSWFNDV